MISPSDLETLLRDLVCDSALHGSRVPADKQAIHDLFAKAQSEQLLRLEALIIASAMGHAPNDNWRCLRCLVLAAPTETGMRFAMCCPVRP